MLMPFLLKFAVIMPLIQFKMFVVCFFFSRFSQCSSLVHVTNDVLLSFSGLKSCAK